MKKRYTKYEVEDNRKVVVYARKSVITNKGYFESIKFIFSSLNLIFKIVGY